MDCRATALEAREAEGEADLDRQEGEQEAQADAVVLVSLLVSEAEDKVVSSDQARVWAEKTGSRGVGNETFYGNRPRRTMSDGRSNLICAPDIIQWYELSAQR